MNCDQIILIILVYLAIINGFEILEGRWYKIFVEMARIQDESSFAQEKTETGVNAEHFLVLLRAFKLDWATLACVLSPTTIQLSVGLISPFYQNSSEETYTCYTRLHKDLVFGSHLDGTKTFGPGYEHRNETNLSRGFYMGKVHNCCTYITSSAPLWLLVDLGQPKTFTTVTMTGMGGSNPNNWLGAGNIWYGNSSTSNGDFSGFVLFDSFSDFTAPSETREVQVPNSVTAQFVGIKLNSGFKLYLCYLQIY